MLQKENAILSLMKAAYFINFITPKTIIKSIPEQVATLDDIKHKSVSDLTRDSIDIEASMKKYAEDLDFERAIECRERLKRIQKEIEKKNDK